MICCAFLPSDPGQLGGLQLNHAPNHANMHSCLATFGSHVSRSAQEDIQ